jgi:hypothetical protein
MRRQNTDSQLQPRRSQAVLSGILPLPPEFNGRFTAPMGGVPSAWVM